MTIYTSASKRTPFRPNETPSSRTDFDLPASPTLSSSPVMEEESSFTIPIVWNKAMTRFSTCSSTRPSLGLTTGFALGDVPVDLDPDERSISDSFRPSFHNSSLSAVSAACPGDRLCSHPAPSNVSLTNSGYDLCTPPLTPDLTPTSSVEQVYANLGTHHMMRSDSNDTFGPITPTNWSTGLPASRSRPQVDGLHELGKEPGRVGDGQSEFTVSDYLEMANAIHNQGLPGLQPSKHLSQNSTSSSISRSLPRSSTTHSLPRSSVARSSRRSSSTPRPATANSRSMSSLFSESLSPSYSSASSSSHHHHGVLDSTLQEELESVQQEEEEDEEDPSQIPFTTTISLVFDQESWRSMTVEFSLVARDYSTGQVTYAPNQELPLAFNVTKMQASPSLQQVLVEGKDYLTRKARLNLKQNGEWNVGGKEGGGEWALSYRVQDRTRITGAVKQGEKNLIPLKFICQAQVLDPSRTFNLYRKLAKEVAPKLRSSRSQDSFTVSRDRRSASTGSSRSRSRSSDGKVSSIFGALSRKARLHEEAQTVPLPADAPQKVAQALPPSIQMDRPSTASTYKPSLRPALSFERPPLSLERPNTADALPRRPYLATPLYPLPKSRSLGMDIARPRTAGAVIQSLDPTRPAGFQFDATPRPLTSSTSCLMLSPEDLAFISARPKTARSSTLRQRLTTPTKRPTTPVFSDALLMPQKRWLEPVFPESPKVPPFTDTIEIGPL